MYPFNWISNKVEPIRTPVHSVLSKINKIVMLDPDAGFSHRGDFANNFCHLFRSFHQIFFLENFQLKEFSSI